MAWQANLIAGEGELLGTDEKRSGPPRSCDEEAGKPKSFSASEDPSLYGRRQVLANSVSPLTCEVRAMSRGVRPHRPIFPCHLSLCRIVDAGNDSKWRRGQVPRHRESMTTSCLGFRSIQTLNPCERDGCVRDWGRCVGGEEQQRTLTLRIP